MSQIVDLRHAVRRALALAGAVTLWAGIAWPAAANDLKPVADRDEGTRGSVKIKTLGDGTRVMYNENPQQRASRASLQLLKPPAKLGLPEKITRYARAQGLSPRLVQALVQVESGYNPRALSNKGAMGLMQLMPDTARELGVTDAYDPDQNLRGGTRYLWQMIRRYQGNLELALAAYNAGPTAVSRYGGVPPYAETQRYIAKVMALYTNSPPPAWLKEHARHLAHERKLETAERLAQERESRGGSKVYLTRDENDNIVMTTTPPGGR